MSDEELDFPPDARLRAALPRYTAPAPLRDRIEALVADAERKPASNAVLRAVPWRAWFAGAAMGVAATLAGVIVASHGWPWQPPGADAAMLADDAVAEHVHATLAGHRIEVASSDRHTVKPWLSAHLDYSPPVRDFAAQGFALEGARIDRLQGRATAVLVYRHGQHTIDVFVRPREPGADVARTAIRGFNVIPARDDAMDWWVVSDVDADVLAAFAAALVTTEPVAIPMEPGLRGR